MDSESFNFAISSHASVMRVWFCEMLALGCSAEQYELTTT